MNISPITFFGVSTEAPAEYPLAAGHVAMYTRASPEKTGPSEDAAALVPVDPVSGVLVVADGAGGHHDGAAAARIAVEQVVAALAQTPRIPLHAAILNGVEAAHHVIQERVSGAATTIAIVEIVDGAVRTYHTGDTGVCVIGGRGRIKLQTVFHSPTGYGVEAGLLDEQDALHHEKRHIVSNLVGMGPMSVEIGLPMMLAPRDTLIVASDGLFDNLYIDEIAALVRKGGLGTACENLVAAARNRMQGQVGEKPSKADDLTVMLYRRTPTSHGPRPARHGDGTHKPSP